MADQNYIDATRAWQESVKQHIRSLERAIEYDSEEILHLEKMIALRKEEISHFTKGIEQSEADLQKNI